VFSKRNVTLSFDLFPAKKVSLKSDKGNISSLFRCVLQAWEWVFKQDLLFSFARKTLYLVNYNAICWRRREWRWHVFGHICMNLLLFGGGCGSRFESVKTEIFICSYLLPTIRQAFRYISISKLTVTIRYCQTTNCKEMSLFGFDWLHLSKQQTIYSYANTKHNMGFKITKLFPWLTHLFPAVSVNILARHIT